MGQLMSNQAPALNCRWRIPPGGKDNVASQSISLGADLIGAVLVGVHPNEAEHCSGYYDRSLDYRATREQIAARKANPVPPPRNLAA